MERAAAMTQAANEKSTMLVFDSGGTAAGATAAAKQAMRSHAGIIIGPLLSIEVPAVLAVTRSTLPVITFSNDAALLDSGAFVFGITPRQTVSAILRYAAGRGVKRVAIGGGTGDWGRQALLSGTQVGKQLGIETWPLSPQLLAVGADALPDAVLITNAAQLAEIAPAAAAQGVQLLAAMPSLDLSPEALRVLEGAWFAAPDPGGFAGFAHSFEERNGSRPGTITGLAYDALNIVRQIRAGGGTDRSALLSPSGFKGVCGEVRFREDGSVARGLAVLAVVGGQLRKVAASSVS